MSKPLRTKIKLTGDNKELIVTLNDARDEVNDFANSTKKAEKKSSGSFKKIAGVAGTVLAVLGFLKKSMDIERETGKLRAGVQTITGSVGETREVMRALNDIAKDTPFALEQSVDGFRKLVNLGLTPSKDAIMSYGNTAAAMGKDLDQMIEAVADATTGEFERLKEFGIKAKQNGDKVSLTFQGTTTTIGNNAQEIENYLMALGENEFAGAMANRMQSLDGQMATFTQNWENTFRIVNDMGMGDTIADAFGLANEAIEEFNAMLESGQLIGYLNAWLSGFDGFARDVEEPLNFITDLIDDLTQDWDGDVGDTIDFFINAFKSLPNNVRAFLQIMTTEVLVGLDKTMAYATEFKDATKALFTDDTIQDAENRRKARIAEINKLRDDSISAILNELEADKKSTQLKIQNADALRKKFDEERASYKRTDNALLASYKVKSKISADTVKQSKAEIKALKEAEKAEQRRLNSLSKWWVEYRDEIDPARAALEEYNDTLAKLNELRASGANITESDYFTGVRLASQKYQRTLVELASDEKPKKKAEEQLTAYQQSVHDMLGDLDGVFQNTWSNLDQGFGGVVDGMKRAFSNLLGDMIHQATTRPILMNIQSSVTGGTGSVGAGVTGAAFNPWVAAAAITVAGVSSAISKQNQKDDARARLWTSEYRQGVQFTGTVLGDLKAQSHSVVDLTKSLSGIAGDALSVNRDMYQSLLRIETNLQKTALGVSKQLSRNGGLESFTTQRSTSDGVDKLLLGTTFFKSGLLGKLDIVFGGFIKSVLGSVSKSIYSKKRELTDAGLVFNHQTLGDIRRTGQVGLYGYQGIKTTRRTLGFKRSSYSEQYQSVDAQVKRQLGLAFENAGNVFDQFNRELGLGLEQTIANFKVSNSRLSLKGLRGEKLTQAIESFLSNTLDNWSTEFLQAGGLKRLTDEYQKSGEGQFQTLGRLVAQSREWQSVSGQLGLQFSATKVHALELTQQLAQTAGGFDKLLQNTAVFRDKFFTQGEKQDLLRKQLDNVFHGLGRAVPTTRAEFKNLVQSLDLTTARGRELYAQYIALSPALDKYLSGLKENVLLFDQFGGQLAKNSNAWSEHFANLASWGKREQNRVRGEYTERLELARKTEQTIKQLNGWLQEVYLSDLSTAIPQARLQQSASSYQDLLARAKAGDTDALSQLSSAAQTYLTQADKYYGRTAEYARIFEQVTRDVKALSGGLSGGDTVQSLTAQMNKELQAVKDTVLVQIEVAKSQAETAIQTLDVLRALPRDVGDTIAKLIDVTLSRAPSRAPVIDGSHANGLARVPFDGYIAELHKGETVLPAGVANALRNVRGDTASHEALIDVIQVLTREVAQLKQEQIRYNQKAEQQMNDAINVQKDVKRGLRNQTRVTA